MQNSLQMIFDRLLENVSEEHYRYLFFDLKLTGRLTGITGPRGVGKTTLLLQYIKSHRELSSQIFYFSADHIAFTEISIYEFVEELYLTRSVRFFFVDEIHKYDNWSQELKNLYDGFPDIKIIFSGSSSLDLVKGSYDLSRRANILHLPGLSFREYLNFYCGGDNKSYSFDELMSRYIEIGKELSAVPGILGHFHDYLKQGFYPFAQEDPLTYYEKLLAIIEKTIYEDVSNFYSLKTGSLRCLNKIVSFLADTPPGNISTYNLGKNLKIDDKTAANYLKILSETGLVEIIYPAESGNLRLRKPEKVFLNNTNLQYALGGHLSGHVDIGTIRELSFVQSLVNAGYKVFYSKHGDYQVQGNIFEIGGKNKTRKQIKNVENSFVVKDDTVSSHVGMIPLFYFGFLY